MTHTGISSPTRDAAFAYRGHATRDQAVRFTEPNDMVDWTVVDPGDTVDIAVAVGGLEVVSVEVDVPNNPLGLGPAGRPVPPARRRLPTRIRPGVARRHRHRPRRRLQGSLAVVRLETAVRASRAGDPATRAGGGARR